jgi:hypothetical protein
VVLRGPDRSEFWHAWTADTWVQEFGDAEKVPVAVDGEAVTVRAPLRFRIRPGALRLLVPPDVPDARSRDPRVASHHSAAYAWHTVRRWVRMTHSGRRRSGMPR